MTTNQKKLTAGMYWILFLILMMVEPNDSVTLKQMLGYYAFVLANFTFATFLLKSLFKNVDTTTN
jgi:hypothetical protein